MSVDRATQDYNAELADLLMQMATEPTFEARRELFHAELHRVFEPDFLPALFQLMGVMAQVGGEQEQAVTLIVFASMVLEIRDFLAGLPAESLSPTAIAVELLVRPLAATLSPPWDSREPGPELAAGAVRHERVLIDVAARDQVFAEIEQMAAVAEERSHGDGPFYSSMAEIAADWRGLPERVGLLLTVLETAGSDEPLAVQDGDFVTATLAEAMTREAAAWLEAALRGIGDEHRLQGLARLSQAGAVDEERVSDETIDRYLTQLGPLLGPWPEEATTRRELAGAGPAVLLPLLRRAVRKLRSFGGSQNAFAAAIAERGTDLVMERVASFLAELVDTSRVGDRALIGSLIGEMLALAMRHDDPALRALAAMLCNFDGVADTAIAQPLMSLFVGEHVLVVRVAAATVLVRELPGIDQAVRVAAREVLDGVLREGFPEIRERVEGMAVGMDGDDRGTLYGMAVMPMLPQFIAAS